MKNFFTKYWKRILILIAIIFIIINIVSKCVAPHTLISEYAKYGPDVKYENNLNLNIGDSLGSNDLMSNVQSNSPFNETTFRYVMIIILLIIGALLLGDILNKKSSSSAKKK